MTAPPQQYPPAHGQPPYRHSTTTATGLPVWVGLAVAVVIGVAMWFLMPTVVHGKDSKPDAQGSSTSTSTSTSAARPASNTVSTATRPPRAERTYADPLPAAVRLGGGSKVYDLDTDNNTDPPSYDGSYRPVSKAQFAAWIAKLKGHGWKNKPGEKNDASQYDLINGKARILGDYNDYGGSETSMTFVYDPRGNA